MRQPRLKSLMQAIANCERLTAGRGAEGASRMWRAGATRPTRARRGATSREGYRRDARKVAFLLTLRNSGYSFSRGHVGAGFPRLQSRSLRYSGRRR